MSAPPFALPYPYFIIFIVFRHSGFPQRMKNEADGFI